jgi:signal transduction histidine kinase
MLNQVKNFITNPANSLNIQLQVISIFFNVVLFMLSYYYTNIFINEYHRQRKTDLQEKVYIAKSILLYHYQEELNNNLNRSEVKRLALLEINRLRFSEDNYIFVYDTKTCELLVNYTRPDLIGKYRCDVQSSDGQYYVRDMITIATSVGYGFITYKFNNAITKNSKNDNIKISYIDNFYQWDLMIGCGTHIHDMDIVVDDLKYMSYRIITFLSLLFLFLMTNISGKIDNRIQELTYK